MPRPPTVPKVPLPLETHRLVLRLPRAPDLPGLVASINDRRISEPTTIPYPYGPSQARSFARSSRRKYDSGAGFDLLAFHRDDGRLIGGFGLNLRALDRPGPWAEVGYWIAVHEWGNGYASEGLQAVLRAGFSTMRLHRLEAWVKDYNRGSHRVLRKAGFREEGRARSSVRAAGRWHDRVLYGMLRPEYVPRHDDRAPRPRSAPRRPSPRGD